MATLRSSTLHAALTGGWFGAGLSATVRAQLAGLATEASYPAGATILEEGALVDALGIVVDGRVAVRLHVPGRGTQTILTVEPGDLVGWSALVTPHRSTSTVIALEPATIVNFNGPALRVALEADPMLAAAVLSRVFEAVGRRLTATRTQLLDLFARSAEEPW